MGLVSTRYTPGLSFYEITEDQEFALSAISDELEHNGNEHIRAITRCLSSSAMDIHYLNKDIGTTGHLMFTQLSDDEFKITGIDEYGEEWNSDCLKISGPSPAGRSSPGVSLLRLFKR
jgi:hypothetical protein